MKLDLNEDQQFFQETVRRFVETETPTSVVRGLLESPDGYDATWWRRGAELGWTSFLVPDALGGGSVSGKGLVDLAIVAEELGRAVAPGPLVPVNVVAETLGRVGTPPQQELLGEVMVGETILAWAFNEPGGDWSAEQVELTATPEGEGFRLDGTKVAVEAAAQAQHLLVTARAASGLSQFLVPAAASGLTITPQTSLDLTRRFGRVELDGVVVGPDAVVGAVGAAGPDVDRQRLVAMVLQCAGMAGAMARVFEFTVEYAFDRISFGRPLASYQALKHRFADMKLWLEASHAVADSAAASVATGALHAAAEVSAAKCYVGDRAVEAIQDCVQLHGGIGVTWEHDIHLYLRRVTVDRGLFGTPAGHRALLAAAVAV